MSIALPPLKMLPPRLQNIFGHKRLYAASVRILHNMLKLVVQSRGIIIIAKIQFFYKIDHIADCDVVAVNSVDSSGVADVTKVDGVKSLDLIDRLIIKPIHVAADLIVQEADIAIHDRAELLDSQSLPGFLADNAANLKCIAVCQEPINPLVLLVQGAFPVQKEKQGYLLVVEQPDRLFSAPRKPDHSRASDTFRKLKLNTCYTPHSDHRHMQPTSQKRRRQERPFAISCCPPNVEQASRLYTGFIERPSLS